MELWFDSAGARGYYFSDTTRLALAPSLLFNGYQETFPQVLSNWDVMLTTHSHPTERLRMSGAILLLPHKH